MVNHGEDKENVSRHSNVLLPPSDLEWYHKTFEEELVHLDHCLSPNNAKDDNLGLLDSFLKDWSAKDDATLSNKSLGGSGKSFPGCGSDSGSVGASDSYLKELQEDNKRLKQQISKLKLSLALSESDKVNNEQETAENYYYETEEMYESETYTLVDEEQAYQCFLLLSECESFQLIGTGDSVLDSLSHHCRRDVYIAYCQVMDHLQELFES